jgi:hypothetical protein
MTMVGVIDEPKIYVDLGRWTIGVMFEPRFGSGFLFQL